MAKLEFISMIEGVEETMPIIPASQHKYSWVQKAAKDFKDNGSLDKDNYDIQHTSKCPGIIKLKGKGFIARNHSDIKLSLKNNSYEWNTPTNWTKMSDNLCEDTITHHFQESLHDFMSDWPKDTLPIVLKINLPWYIRIPKGWEVLVIDPFYKDDYRFTVCPGIFEHELGLARINVPVFWHNTSGEFLIKAGTPIAQLIPIKTDTIDYSLTNKTEDKKFKQDIEVLILKLKENFNTNYNKVRNFFRERDG